MNAFNFAVRYETVDDQLAKAFVNDVYVGRIKLADKAITFRNSSAPWKRKLRNLEEYRFDDAIKLADHLEARDIREQLLPLIVKSFLQHTSYLYDLPEAA